MAGGKSGGGGAFSERNYYERLELTEEADAEAVKKVRHTDRGTLATDRQDRGTLATDRQDRGTLATDRGTDRQRDSGTLATDTGTEGQ
eukprot:COSAG02_NODE_9899_length_2079_cov_10.421028_2_plen_88_part_00